MPDNGGKGKRFSSEYQPEGRGRKKGSKNRKNILESMLALAISTDNLALGQIKQELPHLFKDEEGKDISDVTIQEAIFARLIRQAIMDKKPLPYMKEIWDRLDGKATIKVQKEDDIPQVDPDERARVLEEKIKEAEDDKKRRESE